MTTDAQPAPRFPLGLAALVLTVSGATLYGVAALVVSAAQGGVAGAQLAVAFGATLVWLTSVLTVVLVKLVSRRSVMAVVGAYFASMGVRMIGCLGGAMLAVHVNDLPKMPMAIVLGITYMPLLMIEAAFIGRFVWRKDPKIMASAATVKRQASKEVTA